MQNFFSYKNNQAYWWLSKFAHPTNIFQNGYCEVIGSNMYVTIKSGNYTAKYKIHKNGSFFDSIETIEDNDWAKAFRAADVAKDIIVYFWRNYSSSTISKIESKFGLLDYLGGEQMCLAVLSVLYMNYPNNAYSNSQSVMPRNQTQKLYGCVGDYPITMSIVNKGNYIEGAYYYNRKGPGNRLTLLGTLEDGLMYLSEANEYGQKTGSFIGSYNDGVYRGRFTTTQGKEYPFIVSVR